MGIYATHDGQNGLRNAGMDKKINIKIASLNFKQLFLHRLLAWGISRLEIRSRTLQLQIKCLL